MANVIIDKAVVLPWLVRVSTGQVAATPLKLPPNSFYVRLCATNISKISINNYGFTFPCGYGTAETHTYGQFTFYFYDINNNLITTYQCTFTSCNQQFSTSVPPNTVYIEIKNTDYLTLCYLGVAGFTSVDCLAIGEKYMGIVRISLYDTSNVLVATYVFALKLYSARTMSIAAAVSEFPYTVNYAFGATVPKTYITKIIMTVTSAYNCKLTITMKKGSEVSGSVTLEPTVGHLHVPITLTTDVDNVDFTFDKINPGDPGFSFAAGVLFGNL